MSVSSVSKTVVFGDLCVLVAAWRYECDKCGRTDHFHDVPTPYLERDGPFKASEIGWKTSWSADDEERTFCPGCTAQPPQT